MEAHEDVTARYPAVVEAVPSTSKKILKKLLWIYIAGSFTAIPLVLILAYLGLEFTVTQWIFILSACPVAASLWIVPDLYLISNNFKPIKTALDILDRGETLPDDIGEKASIAALNHPFTAFLRVTVFHGPMAAVACTLMLITGNLFFDREFHLWQGVIFFVMVLVFASPAHAIFEFFAVSKAILPVLERLSKAGREIGREHIKELKSTSIRNKLLYLAIFVSALPLAFLAASVIFKVDRLMQNMGLWSRGPELFALSQWVIGVVVICMGGALALA